MAWEIICAAVLAFMFGWAHGYQYGKKMMLALMRNHHDNGVQFGQALDYEQDVLDGKVPRG